MELFSIQDFRVMDAALTSVSGYGITYLSREKWLYLPTFVLVSHLRSVCCWSPGSCYEQVLTVA